MSEQKAAGCEPRVVVRVRSKRSRASVRRSKARWISLSINSWKGMPPGSPEAARLESAFIAAKCFTDVLRDGYEQRPIRGAKLFFFEDVGYR